MANRNGLLDVNGFLVEVTYYPSNGSVSTSMIAVLATDVDDAKRRAVRYLDDVFPLDAESQVKSVTPITLLADESVQVA